MTETSIHKYLLVNKNMATFSRYCAGTLYYKVELEDGIYEFPISTVSSIEKFVEEIVNVDDKDKVDEYILHDLGDHYESGINTVYVLDLSPDLGTTSFEAEIKGSELNRWIKVAFKNQTLVKLN